MLRLTLLLLCGNAIADFDPDINEKYESLPREEFIEYFNGQNFSWKIAHYEHLEGLSLGHAMNYADIETLAKKIDKNFIKNFDAKDLSKISYVRKNLDNMSYNIMKNNKNSGVRKKYGNLPENFDARKNWPHCPSIREIHNQGDCGSSWGFGPATTMSDRTCIHTNTSVSLSVQDLECCNSCALATKCVIGISAHVFKFWVTNGLVSQECKPYNIEQLRKGTCNTTCKNGKDYKMDKHYGSFYYNVDRNEDVIMAELVKNGSIATDLAMYEDFKDYKGGIYEYKYGKFLGGQNVRVIGYGVENEVKYWLAANSFGSEWGEKGFFRIKRYQEYLGFENNMKTGMPRK